jgi:hypothetical protein
MIEVGGRLVEQEGVGVRRDGAGDLDAFQFAEIEPVDVGRDRDLDADPVERGLRRPFPQPRPFCV